MMRINLLDRKMLAEAAASEKLIEQHARQAEIREMIPLIGNYLAQLDRTMARLYAFIPSYYRALAQYRPDEAREIMWSEYHSPKPRRYQRFILEE